jgi:hypothetical protein
MHGNSGGASSSHATVTGGAWVHAPLQEQPSNRGGLDRLLPLFFSSSAVKITVTCNQKKTHKQSVLVIFLDLFSSDFHPCLLHFLLSQVCSWGFAVFSSASGTWAPTGGDLDRFVMAAGRRCWLKKAGSSGR